MLVVVFRSVINELINADILEKKMLSFCVMPAFLVLPGEFQAGRPALMQAFVLLWSL